MTEADAAAPDAEMLKFEAIVAEFRDKLIGQPDAAFPELADALVGLSAKQAELGSLDDALANGRAAVSQFQKLHEKDAAAYVLGLAAALNNLSNRLSDLGRDDEGRESAEDAILHAQRAMEAHPEQARFVQVSALMGQSGRSWRGGQSLRAIEELGTAVDIFRDGGDSMNPFLGVVVDVLHRNAMSLSEAGRWEEAIALRRMAVKLFPEEGVPAPVVHLLALTLQQGAMAASREGRAGQSLPMAEEAADLAQDLAEAMPEQYNLFLAQSLANLATRQHEARADEQAMEAAIEAINAFQAAARIDAASAVLPLASTLETFASILNSLGHTEQARTALSQRDQLLASAKKIEE